MTSLEIPATGSAAVHVRHNGYAHGPAPHEVTDIPGQLAPVRPGTATQQQR